MMRNQGRRLRQRIALPGWATGSRAVVKTSRAARARRMRTGVVTKLATPTPSTPGWAETAGLR